MRIPLCILCLYLDIGNIQEIPLQTLCHRSMPNNVYGHISAMFYSGYLTRTTVRYNQQLHYDMIVENPKFENTDQYVDVNYQTTRLIKYFYADTQAIAYTVVCFNQSVL